MSDYQVILKQADVVTNIFLKKSKK